MCALKECEGRIAFVINQHTAVKISHKQIERGDQKLTLQ